MQHPFLGQARRRSHSSEVGFDHETLRRHSSSSEESKAKAAGRFKAASEAYEALMKGRLEQRKSQLKIVISGEFSSFL